MATTAQPTGLGEFYDADEVAAALKVSRQTVYRLFHSGELKAVKVGNQYRVRGDVLRAFVGLSDAETPAASAA